MGFQFPFLTFVCLFYSIRGASGRLSDDVICQRRLCNQHHIIGRSIMPFLFHAVWIFKIGIFTADINRSFVHQLDKILHIA